MFVAKGFKEACNLVRKMVGEAPVWGGQYFNKACDPSGLPSVADWMWKGLRT